MRTAFRPDVDGFAFVNDWVYDDVEKARFREILLAATPIAMVALAPVLGPLFPLGALPTLIGRELVDRFDGHVGFCGGMTAAALDYHRLGGLPPRGAGLQDQPDRRSPAASALRSYILTRLWEGLATDAPRFLEYMALLHLLPAVAGGGPPALLRRSRAEVDRLVRMLDQSPLPVTLGLVGSTRDPFANHTVLVLGYTPLGADRWELAIYDPNLPGEEGRLRLDLSDASGLSADEGRSASAARGPLRGVLVQSYAPRSPPPSLEATLSPRVPGATIGQPLALSLTVRSVGYAATPPLQLWVEGEAGAPRDPLAPWDPRGDSTGERVAAPLAPGASRALEATAWPDRPGSWTFTAAVWLSGARALRWPLVDGAPVRVSVPAG